MEAATITPRDFQLHCLQHAIEHNTIVHLGTGTGKTLIAIMLIRHYAQECSDSSAKRIVLIVPTVPLVHQQASAIETHITNVRVGRYCGETNVARLDAAAWHHHLATNQVLVMTGKVFEDALHRHYIAVGRLRLLVVDECHHTQSNHPYKVIMRFIRRRQQNDGDQLRILGLTASPITKESAGKKSKLARMLRDLEASMCNSRIITAPDVDAVESFAASPDEIVSLCPFVDAPDTASDAMRFKADLNECIASCKLDSAMELLGKALQQALWNYEELGALALYHTLELLFRTLLLGPNPASTGGHWQLRVTTRLRTLFVRIEQRLRLRADDASVDLLTTACSARVRHLVQLLRQFWLESPPTDAHDEKRAFHCLVFAERRFAVRALSDTLQLLSRHHPDYAFIDANFAVGSNSPNGILSVTTHGSSKKNADKLRQFKEGSLNVLVATSVMEEGIDVRRCNYVIRFDRAKCYRAFTQSKGRARMRGGKFVLMTTREDESAVERKKHIYAFTDNFLFQQSSVERPAVSDKEVAEAHDTLLIRPYEPDRTAQINMNNAVATLYQYCALRGGAKPSVKFDRRPRPTSYGVAALPTDGASTTTLFRCRIRMPAPSPCHREEIVGAWAPSDAQAKQAAAQLVCEELHRLGELNSHLLPRSNTERKDDLLIDHLRALGIDDDDGSD